MSMVSQRLDVLVKRFQQLAGQLPDVHPDSPHAETLREEMEKIQEELQDLMPQIIAAGPWWGRLFIWCCEAAGLLFQPLFRAGYRLYHMVKAL